MSYQLYWSLVGAAITLGVAAVVWAAVYLPGIVRQRRANRQIAQAVSMREAGIDQVYARSVDRIDIGNIQDTGLTTPIDRYTFDMEIWWTDQEGNARHYGPAQHVWPNDLADVPNRIIKEWAVDLVTQAVRWTLGIDPEPEP